MPIFFVQLARSLPLIIFLIVLALVISFLYRKSPYRAKEVLIKLFTWLSLGLTIFFSLACLYAWFEHNEIVLDLMVGFLVVSVVSLIIVRVCRAVFVHHHPHYRKARTAKAKKRMGPR